MKPNLLHWLAKRNLMVWILAVYCDMPPYKLLWTDFLPDPVETPVEQNAGTSPKVPT